jgi:hypothetical protein
MALVVDEKNMAGASRRGPESEPRIQIGRSVDACRQKHHAHSVHGGVADDSDLTDPSRFGWPLLPVEVVLHPSWWHAHAGITFDEDFFVEIGVGPE